MAVQPLALTFFLKGQPVIATTTQTTSIRCCHPMSDSAILTIASIADVLILALGVLATMALRTPTRLAPAAIALLIGEHIA